MQKSINIRLSERSYDELHKQGQKHKVSDYALCKSIIGKWLSEHRRGNSVDATTAELIEGNKYVSDSRASGRNLSEAVLLYKDPHNTLSTYASMVEYGATSQRLTDDIMYILDKMLIRLLPKSIKQKLRLYSMTKDIPGQSLSTAMIEMIGEHEVDSIGYEVNQEFEDMMQDASAHEAFNRGLK